MLQQIISHTPIYVWAILGFLVYRGVAASQDRTVTLRSLFIIPAVMLGLSLQDIANRFGLHGAPLAAWIIGAALSTGLTWQLIDGKRINVNRAEGSVTVRGSWLPLALMMAIFCAKYAVAIAFAMSPALRQEALFAVTVCATFGLFNGVFLGRLLGHLAAYLKAASQAGLQSAAN
ncbi:hypothetical protein H7U20_06995 [Rugamonas sp. CCM 8940]|nr:DUF6622 family protein [Rugamonas sp. CCM 8940]MBJ7309942.1 hypothetical protein [Rugamonas sp. CCM 8940]